MSPSTSSSESNNGERCGAACGGSASTLNLIEGSRVAARVDALAKADIAARKADRQEAK